MAAVVDGRALLRVCVGWVGGVLSGGMKHVRVVAYSGNVCTGMCTVLQTRSWAMRYVASTGWPALLGPWCSDPMWLIERWLVLSPAFACKIHKNIFAQDTTAANREPEPAYRKACRQPWADPA